MVINNLSGIIICIVYIYICLCIYINVCTALTVVVFKCALLINMTDRITGCYIFCEIWNSVPIRLTCSRNSKEAYTYASYVNT